MQTTHIQSYNLVDFLIEVEKHINDGYTFDFTNIPNFPQQVGGTFVAGMVKQEQKEVKSVVESTTEGDKTPLEAPESTPGGVGSQEVNKETVEAPKKAETAAQDVKAKTGRKAKVIE